MFRGNEVITVCLLVLFFRVVEYWVSVVDVFWESEVNPSLVRGNKSGMQGTIEPVENACLFNFEFDRRFAAWCLGAVHYQSWLMCCFWRTICYQLFLNVLLLNVLVLITFDFWMRDRRKLDYRKKLRIMRVVFCSSWSVRPFIDWHLQLTVYVVYSTFILCGLSSNLC